jgi:hypothetical protein
MTESLQEKILLLLEWGISLGITLYLALGVINTYIVVTEY